MGGAVSHFNNLEREQESGGVREINSFSLASLLPYPSARTVSRKHTNTESTP